jgi:RecG-like helicase
MAGTQQSGLIELKLTNLAEDKELVVSMYAAASRLVAEAGPAPATLLQQPWAKALYMTYKPIQNLQKVG